MRLPLLLHPAPYPAPDSAVYLQAADDIINRTGSTDSPPEGLYPGMLALIDRSLEGAVLVQHVMGIATSLLCFLLALYWTGSRLWAACAGILCGTALNSIAYEHMLLTEAPAALLFTSMTLLLIRVTSDREGQLHGPVCAISGILMGLTVLLRPVTVAAACVLLPAAALRGPRRRALVCTAVCLSVLALTVAAWMLTVSGGRFPAGFPGLNMTNQTGDFLESAPDRYAVARDVYIARRDSAGTHRMIIWSAVPDMMQETGLSYRELDGLTLRMCVSAAAARPLRYAGAVLASLAGTWKGCPLPGTGDNGTGGAIRGCVWPVQRILLLTVRGLFLAGLLALAMPGPRRVLSKAVFLLPVMLAIMSVLLITALVESANPRYLVPFQPLLIAVSSTTAAKLMEYW